MKLTPPFLFLFSLLRVLFRSSGASVSLREEVCRSV